MIELPHTGRKLALVSGPEKLRNEFRWSVTTEDGDPAVLAQLLTELAREEPLRRRYVYEAERLSGLGAECIPPLIALGPLPDPRAPDAVAPWRLRADPPGTTFAAWLDARAPAPVDQAVAEVARIADAIHEVHLRGGVLRDLHPRQIVLGDDDRIWLVDVGLARLDILSTRTASSLMLEASPYAAPEHLRATVVDSRADVYTLGALLWHALTGVPPLSGSSPLVRDDAALPPLASLCPDATPALAELVARCLASDPDVRPASASDVADVLWGRAELPGLALEQVRCQNCGVTLRTGLRLCLGCGRQAVQFSHVDSGEERGYSLVLTRARDDEVFHRKLAEFFELLGEGPPPRLDFLIGDPRLYSKRERKELLSLPVTLFADLPHDTARRLQAILAQDKIATKIAPTRSRWNRKVVYGGAAGFTAGITALLVMATGLPWFAALTGAAVAAIVGLTIALFAIHRRLAPATPLRQLRAAPAALPASDPLVARLADLLSGDLAADVRERVAELALLVQRVVDRRVHAAADANELALATGPIEPLVRLVEREVRAIGHVDAALRDLDEGTLVRAIAASEARRESEAVRRDLVIGLDRLRSLEDARSTHMARLLEAESLIRRSVDLAMTAIDQDAVADRYLAMARATLALPEGDT